MREDRCARRLAPNSPNPFRPPLSPVVSCYSVGTHTMIRRAFLALSPPSLLLPACAASRRQDTGFLNRTIDVKGVLHRYVVYLPENWSPNQLWPIILFLHGSGERGDEGRDETKIGLPRAFALHPHL